MNPFRCSNCKKLLGMIEGKAEIKCPKCKTMNVTPELLVISSELMKTGKNILNMEQ